MIEEVPELPDLKAIASALTPAQVKAGIIGLNGEIDEGTKVALRLDIPAYDNYDTNVVSIHDGKTTSGKAIGYGQAAIIKNVKFKSSASGALGIATGQPKSTIARMYGDWVNKSPEEIQEMARKAIDSGDWVQIGVNPFRHSWFYDKADGMPVVSASEVLQVGPLVLAKKNSW